MKTNKYKRKTNKNVVKEIGEVSFGYDENYEMYVYKFLCGEKIKRKIQKKLEANGDCYYSHKKWGKYIRKKYGSVNTLEFECYIDYKLCQLESNRITNNIIVPTIIALYLAYPVERLVNILFDLHNSGSYIDILIESFIRIFLIGVLTWLAFKMISYIFDDVKYNELKSNMLREIKSILKHNQKKE